VTAGSLQESNPGPEQAIACPLARQALIRPTEFEVALLSMANAAKLPMRRRRASGNALSRSASLRHGQVRLALRR